MTKQTLTGSLTPEEKSVVKALLQSGERNQDIQALVNIGRTATINSARITEVKRSTSILPAPKATVDFYRLKKQRFDSVTGLCAFGDERLVRAREAMILAVELFNTPRVAFKAGVFSMLSNVAWTYLLHEHYERAGVTIIDEHGYSLLISQMTARHDCPLSKTAIKNLEALKKIRDVVEHLTIGPFDQKWLPIFQSTCLNFERYITILFGQRLSLGSELGFALQFAKMGPSEIANLQAYDLPPHIASLDAGLKANLSEGEEDNLEYQFKVVYTLTSASISGAHFQFIQPGSAEGEEIQNVLLKFKPSDELYSLKPTQVVIAVNAASSRNFTSDTHQRAWKIYKARPKWGVANPSATNRTFCLYNSAHGDYTYSNEWVAFLVDKISSDEGWEKLRTYK